MRESVFALIIAALLLTGCAPEPVAQTEDIWISSMKIDCEGASDCRSEYESEVIDSAGRGGKEEFAKDLLVFLDDVSDPDIDREEKLYAALERESDLSYFSDDFWEAVETEGRYAFIGVPGVSAAEDLERERGYIPVTFVSPEGDIIGTFEFYFKMDDGVYSPCLLELCDSQ